MPFTFTLVVDGLDFDDVEQISDVVDHFNGNAQLESAQGCQSIVFDLDAPDATVAVRHSLDQLREHFPDLTIREVSRDLVNLTEIGERLDRTRQSAQQLASGTRHSSPTNPFPAPVTVVGSQALWPWPVVRRWLLDQGIEIPFDVTPLDDADVAALNASLLRGCA